MIPDASGHIHLIDIRMNDQEIAPLFNAFNDVIFRLFTRSNPTTPQFIRINNNDQLANSFFNVNHQTRLHIHGTKEKLIVGRFYIGEKAFNILLLCDQDLKAFIICDKSLSEAFEHFSNLSFKLNEKKFPISNCRMEWRWT